MSPKGNAFAPKLEVEFDFISDQKAELPPASTYTSLIKDGIFIITGSNTGLGYEAAKSLVPLGPAKVILAVRSQARGNEAVRKIEEATGVKGVAEVWVLDMGSFASIVAFGERVKGLERLDGISANAAVALDKWTVSDKGHEATHMINVLGTMLLSALVAPKLEETAKKLGRATHLSVVGSGVALEIGANEELQKAIASGKDVIEYFDEESNGLTSRYPLSKLLLLHSLRHYSLTHPPSSTNVIVNFVNPGLCVTELDRNINDEGRAQLALFRQQIGRTAEVGGRTLVHGLFSGESCHGKYTSECVEKDHYVGPMIKGEEGRKREEVVWESVRRAVNGVVPGAL